MKIFVLKILFISILIILGWHHILLAQTVINIEHIDVIKLKKGKGEPLFYQKKESLYREIEINLYDGGRNRFKPSDKWQTYQDIIQPGDKFIAIDSLKSYNPKSLFKYLSKYEFLSFDDNKGDTTYYSLQLFNPYKALVREMDTSNERYMLDSLGDWPRYYFGITSFVILQFRPNKCMLLYQDGDGYFIPEEKKDYIFVKDYPFDTACVRRQKQDNSWKENYEIIEQIIECYTFHESDYYVADTDNDKQILVDKYGNRLLFNSYDSIAKGRYFIFASKGGKTEVYNLFLEPLFKNVRSYAFNFTDYYPQLTNILLGNKVIRIDFEGTINPLKPYSQIISAVPNMHYSSDYKKCIVRLDKDNNIYYCTSFPYGKNKIVKQRNDILLPEGVNTVNANFDEYLLETSSNKKGGWFIVQKKNLTGLYFLRYPEVEETLINADKKLWSNDTIICGAAIKCTQLLPIVFDSITSFSRYDHQRLLIYKNGLIGIYPLQSEAKYVSIEKLNERQFSRFKLPNGKKGWLNLVTDKEFFDQ